MSKVQLELDKQIALSILRKLEALADDAEDSYFLAKQRKCANIAEYEASMTENRKQYSALRKAFQNALGR